MKIVNQEENSWKSNIEAKLRKRNQSVDSGTHNSHYSKTER